MQRIKIGGKNMKQLDTVKFVYLITKLLLSNQ